MKTTIELPDDLMREIKIRAAREDRRLKDLIAELLRQGLADQERHDAPAHRVELPLIKGGHPAPPGQELTPDRIAEILLDQEIENFIKN
ncbi:MAG TPA: antitoxin [Dehalococcoidia bacterium]|nr:antitoxin [Dehalococcoidia bacterium]